MTKILVGLTAKQAAARLKVSRPTLLKWTKLFPDLLKPFYLYGMGPGKPVRYPAEAVASFYSAMHARQQSA